MTEAPKTAEEREAEADRLFVEILAERGKSQCPSCGRVLDRGDVSWNNAATEAGTDYTMAQIQCSACDTEIAHWSSWWPGANSWHEFVENVLEDMPTDDE